MMPPAQPPLRKGHAVQSLQAIFMFFPLFLSVLMSGSVGAGAQSSSLQSLKKASKQENQTAREKASALIDLAWAFRRVDLDSGFIYLAQATQLLPQGSYDSLHFDHDYTLGTLHRYKGNYQKSQQTLLRCLDYSAYQENVFLQGQSHYALSIAYLEDRQFEPAIDHISQARVFFGIESNTEREIGALNVWATILKEITRYEDAEKIYLEAYTLAKKKNILNQLEPISNNLASLYQDQEKFDKALPFYQEALAINEANGDHFGTATLTGNIGNLLLHSGNYPEALAYLTRAIEMKTLLGATEDLIGLRGLLGSTKIYMGQKEEGLALLEASLAEAQENGYKKEENTILNTLIRSTYNTGMYEPAAHYTRIQNKNQRKEFDEVLASKVNELSAQFQKAEQDREIELLSTQNELQKSKLSHQRLLLYGGGAALFIFVALFLVILRFYRKVKKQNVLIAKALQEKEVLLKEIHHRVKNNLQIVSSLLNLQSRKITDEKASEALREGRARVQSMSLIHQTLYHKDDLTGVYLNQYLEKLCASILDTYQVEANRVRLHTNIAPLMLDVDSIIPLGLIINELLTNSLKYAFPDQKKGDITIEIKETENGLHLMVADNGVGIPDVIVKGNSSSFGLEMIDAFKRKLKADLEITNRHGTTVHMLIRNYQKARPSSIRSVVA